MKVLHFSAHSGRTGGGISAARIHNGLLSVGIDSHMCVAFPTVDLPNAFTPNRSLTRRISERILRPIDRWVTNSVSHHYEDGISTGFLGINIDELVRSERPDIVHLHWLAGGSFRLSTLAKIHVPIVWRFPDMWAFCSVEQYQSDRSKYIGGPFEKKSTAHRMSNPAYWAWRNKKITYSKIHDIAVACPSKWLAEESGRSDLLFDREVFVVPTGCDTACFTPHDRIASRKNLGLPVNRKLILVGADNLGVPRKGIDLFIEAMKIVICKRATSDADAPVVVSFGESGMQDGAGGASVFRLGKIEDREILSLLYSACDLFVAPSRMENLANTVLESLACGTPVVAFDIGGMPDMIDHRVNGYLATPFDTSSMAEGIEWALGPGSSATVRQAARDKVLDQFSLQQEIDKYVALYERLLASRA